MECDMPPDNKAFNSDPKVCEEVLKIRDFFGVRCVIETGSYEGNTTLFFGQNFDQVYSVEISERFFNTSRIRCASRLNVSIHQGSSEKFLAELLPTIKDRYENVLFYLDAHWEHYWPLKDEIVEISKHYKNRAILIVDDFYVPNRGFQFDSYNGRRCDFAFIEKEIDLCFDKGLYFYYYLNSTGRKIPIRDGRVGGVGKVFILPRYLLDKHNVQLGLLCRKENDAWYSLL